MRRWLVAGACTILTSCNVDHCDKESAYKSYQHLKEEIAFDSIKFLAGRDTMSKWDAVYVCSCHPDSEARADARHWLRRIGYPISNTDSDVTQQDNF